LGNPEEEKVMRVYIGGTFDILHPGHIKLFRWANQNYGRVVVGLNGDSFIERYKGKPPVMTYGQRADILMELRSVDTVIPNFGDEDSTQSIIYTSPDVIVAGSDWTVNRLMKQMNLTMEFLNEHKIGLVIYPDSDPTHSSDIKARMAC
jgi:cytidyltransferase-like protein